MQITKFGHSCLLVEDGGTRILIDPGTYCEGQWKLANLDGILISHEHGDHCDKDYLPGLVRNNPGVVIYSNADVVDQLKHLGLTALVLDDGQEVTLGQTTIKGIGTKHAVIHPDMGQIHNLGFLVGGRYFHPGDHFTVPHEPVEILGLPVAAPWLKIAESVDYARLVKPKKVLLIHDGMLKITGGAHKVPQDLLSKDGMEVVVLDANELRDF